MTKQTAVVIATRNRPARVAGLIGLLDRQREFVSRVVVVDSSDDPAASELSEVLAGASLRPVLLRSERRSLPGQRNIGVDYLRSSHPRTELIAMLDDDVLPSENYFPLLFSLLERDTVGAVGGVCGSTGWSRQHRRRLDETWRKLFLEDSDRHGTVLPSGFNAPVDGHLHHPVRSQWLMGCAIWRARVFDEFRYDETLVGSALFEDVDFSFRVGQRWALVVEPRARLDHALDEVGRPDARLHHHRLVRNRWQVAQAHPRRTHAAAAFWWATAGEVAWWTRHAAGGSSEGKNRLLGLLSGARDTLLSRDPK